MIDLDERSPDCCHGQLDHHCDVLEKEIDEMRYEINRLRERVDQLHKEKIELLDMIGGKQ